MVGNPVDELISRLEHPDEGARREAVDSLECHPCLQSFEALEWAARKSWDASLRRRASETTERLARVLWRQFLQRSASLQLERGEPRELLSQALLRGDEELCRLAATTVVLLKKDDFLSPMKERLASPSGDAKTRAVLLQALGLLGKKSEVKMLSRWARSSDDLLEARGAVIGLAGMRKARSYAVLCSLLESKEESVSTLALRYLRRLPLREQEKLLYHMIDSKKRKNAVWALEACRLLRVPHYKEILSRVHYGEDKSLRSRVEAILLEMDHGASISLDRGFKELAMKDLGEVVEGRQKSQVPRILARLEAEGNPHNRASLVAALAKLGDESHIALLKGLLQDEDPRVRANAVEALCAVCNDFKDEEVLDALISALGDGNNRVRANAALALQAEHEGVVLWALEDLIYLGGEREQKSALYVIEAADSPCFGELLDYLIVHGSEEVKEKAKLLEQERRTRAHGVAEELAHALNDELRDSLAEP